MMCSKIRYGLICFWITASVAAQDTSLLKYDFIQFDKNRIECIGDPAALDGFYKKLAKVMEKEKGQVTVMHFGGSHLQADIWSGQVRKRFAEMTGGGTGRGFVFPFDIAKTNNPWNYGTEFTGKWNSSKNTLKDKGCDIGALGYEVTTRDSAATITLFNRKTDSLVNYSFSRVKVFHPTGKEQYRIYSDNALVARRHVNPKKGYTEFILKEETDTIMFRLRKTNSEQTRFRLFGFNLESDRPGVYYHAAGVNGADVPDHLRSNRLEEHLAVIRPDLVIFSIGINDAYYPSFDMHAYKENYKKLIERIRSVVPDVNILFTTNNDSYFKRREPNERGVQVQQAMKELSEELNAGVWDLFAVMGGLASVDTWVENELSKSDRIHFTPLGYKVVGELMFQAIMEAFETYQRERK